MIEHLDRALGPLRQRVQGMIARAVVALVDDAMQAQAMQLSVLADETQGDVERFQQYGFTSVPHPGAEAVVVYPGGLRSHGLVIAVEDRRYRLTALSDGEVALYDDQGQAVHLKRDRLLLTSPMRVEVDAPKVVIASADVEIGGEGGPAIARHGDSVVGGKIVASSTTVRAT